jgi:ABC-type sugar transport system permease subunit
MKKLTLAQQRSLSGYIYVLPFLVGFVLLFLSPLVMYVKMSFSEIVPTVGMLNFEPVGWKHYYHILFVEQTFIKDVFASVLNLIYICPAVLLFSFFVASILNQKFKGRTLSRLIFFLPVITASGIALAILSDASVESSISFLAGAVNNPDTINIMKPIYNLFNQLFTDLPVASYITTIIDQIYTIAISSGVQILIFLAGLQTIPSSLYEASSIEGATGWENFWKITLPMISPIIIVNAVYTIIDAMAGLMNPMITTLYTESITNSNYCFSAAMGILYFSISLTILAAIIGIVNRYVFYENR